MANGKDLHTLIRDTKEYTVKAVTLAVEKLTDAFLAKAWLRRMGTTGGEFSQTRDGVAKPIEPFKCCGFRELGKIPLSAFSIKDPIRQSG